MPTDRRDQFSPLGPAAAARWARFAQFERNPYARHLGIVIEEVRRDYCRMRLPFGTHLTQAAGVVHGGAIASLLDFAVVPAVGSAYAADARYVTVDLHVQYLGGVTDEDMIAEGWVTQRGRSLVFCESEIRAGSDHRIVARSVMTYKANGTPVDD